MKRPYSLLRSIKCLGGRTDVSDLQRSGNIALFSKWTKRKILFFIYSRFTFSERWWWSLHEPSQQHCAPCDQPINQHFEKTIGMNMKWNHCFLVTTMKYKLLIAEQNWMCLLQVSTNLWGISFVVLNWWLMSIVYHSIIEFWIWVSKKKIELKTRNWTIGLLPASTNLGSEYF